MIAVRPPVVHEGAVYVILGKDQPEYTPLPGACDADGVVLTEWELTAEELAAVLAGGRVRLWIYTFNRPLQPVALEVVERDGSIASRKD